MAADERDLEQWLDTGLKRYAAVEIPPLLEQRVLAQLRAQPSPSHFFPKWAPAAALAAVVLLGIFLVNRSGRHQNAADVTTQAAISNRSAPAPRAPALPPPSQAGHRTVRRPRARRRFVVLAAQNGPPKLPQFPCARRLSPQDQLLLAYVRQAPRKQVASLLAQEENKIGDLRIQKLYIAPLQADAQETEFPGKN